MTLKQLLGLVIVVFGVAAAIALLAPPEVVAQGCALCYRSAAACGPRAIQALRDGILILIFPPFFICTAITWLAWRRRNLQNQGS
jgi:hypothetical protein